MRKIWVAKNSRREIMKWEASLLLTNVRFSFGDEVYINNNGYAQKRKTDDFFGWCIKGGENFNPRQQIILLDKLEKKMFKDILEV